MTARTKIEQAYYAALQRLIDNKATVSINAVAIEAGKKPGSVRMARFPTLVAEINRVIEVQSKNLIPHKQPKFEAQIKSRDQDLQELKRSYDIALQTVVSLERQVFDLQKELAEFRPSKATIHELPRRVR
ncbi:hypothetical protein [Comamonas thiooxydans]|jgi:hypothetical protein|uniref:hypothetical protein n=1 Tax=Comamonas thiooxydans TaxID=363952 RepID=UPI0015A758CF|nr:hypothetical protein [Comamonas thiooxydans]